MVVAAHEMDRIPNISSRSIKWPIQVLNSVDCPEALIEIYTELSIDSESTITIFQFLIPGGRQKVLKQMLHHL